MPRMPDEGDLPSVGLQSRRIVEAPRDFLGPAVAETGRRIAESGFADLRAQAAEKKRLKGENDVLDSLRATAEWNRRIINERGQYTYDQDQDYGTWNKRFETAAVKHQKAAADLIRDPTEREKFRLRTADDLARYSADVGEKARVTDLGRKREEGLNSIEANLQSASRPDVSSEEAGRMIRDGMNSIDGMVDTGLFTPEEGAKQRILFARRYSAIKANRDIEDDPEKVARWLKGRGTETYFLKLRGQESGGDDLARAGTSTAKGRYQFTDATWADVMRKHPELGLTADGWKEAYQQERAIRAFTNDNRAALEKAGLDVSEKTLYLAHFLGAEGAVQALRARPDAEAASLFPAAAKANRAVFYHRDGTSKTIAEVIANQTRQFSGDVSPQPGYYEFLDPDQRLVLASRAEAETARRYKEARERNDLERFQITTQIENDVTQIEETGQAQEIDPQVVVEALGEAKAAKWLTDRQIAADTFNATSAMESMTDNEIETHVESLEPKPGDENFAARQKVHDTVERRADKLLDLRLKDPAESVSDSAVVRRAAQGLAPDDPTSVQGLVRARLQAQEAVGINASMQQPITRAEARKIIAPIQSIIDQMDATIVASIGAGKGDAATRSAAAKQVRRQAEAEIRSTVEAIDRLYGTYGTEVLAFSIAESVRDKEIGDLAASVLRKIAKGEKIRSSEAQALDAAQDTSIAAKAVEGGLPAPSASAPAAGQAAPKNPAAGLSRGGAPPKHVGRTGKLEAEYPPPSQRAVDYLRRNPSTRTQFETIYGPGAADQWVPL